MINANYLFFWSGIYSNWSKSKFTINSIEFTSGEQALMYAKAKCFNDKEICKKILSTTDVKKQKEYGRLVANYDDAVWSKVRFGVMKEIAYNKFNQDPSLLNALLNTGDRLLVEASPYDTIWGIGMDENHPDIMDESKWKGSNLLGKALTETREKLRLING